MIPPMSASSSGETPEPSDGFSGLGRSPNRAGPWAPPSPPGPPAPPTLERLIPPGPSEVLSGSFLSVRPSIILAMPATPATPAAASRPLRPTFRTASEPGIFTSPAIPVWVPNSVLVSFVATSSMARTMLLRRRRATTTITISRITFISVMPGASMFITAAWEITAAADWLLRTCLTG